MNYMDFICVQLLGTGGSLNNVCECYIVNTENSLDFTPTFSVGGCTRVSVYKNALNLI